MIRVLAVVANIGLIGTAIYFWMARQGMPDTWEKWFFFSMMLVAPVLSRAALFLLVIGGLDDGHQKSGLVQDHTTAVGSRSCRFDDDTDSRFDYDTDSVASLVFRA